MYKKKAHNYVDKQILVAQSCALLCSILYLRVQLDSWLCPLKKASEKACPNFCNTSNVTSTKGANKFWCCKQHPSPYKSKIC